ncbi:MAG: hypothetical protein U0704_05735 [Candidatus Eisenbacteria bacterium]
MCGWCKAVDADGQWVEPELGVELLNLFERDALPEITHGICAECYERVAAEDDDLDDGDDGDEYADEP